MENRRRWGRTQGIQMRGRTYGATTVARKGRKLAVIVDVAAAGPGTVAGGRRARNKPKPLDAIVAVAVAAVAITHRLPTLAPIVTKMSN